MGLLEKIKTYLQDIEQRRRDEIERRPVNLIGDSKYVWFPEDCRFVEEQEMDEILAKASRKADLNYNLSGYVRGGWTGLGKGRMRIATISTKKRGFLSFPYQVAQVELYDRESHPDWIRINLPYGQGIPEQITPPLGCIASIEDDNFRQFIANFYDVLKEVKSKRS